MITAKQIAEANANEAIDQVGEFDDKPTPADIGGGNAMTAIDQAAEYRDLAEALASHYDNACDTLVDEGLLNDENLAEMTRAFRKVALIALPDFHYC